MAQDGQGGEYGARDVAQGAGRALAPVFPERSRMQG